MDGRGSKIQRLQRFKGSIVQGFNGSKGQGFKGGKGAGVQRSRGGRVAGLSQDGIAWIRVRAELGDSAIHVARFGVTRPTFYKAHADFKRAGLVGLLPAKRGPHGPHKVTDEVWLESTPGHTPGHFAVRISSKGQDAVITGDLMHHPIQCRYPEWDDVFDVDGPLAKRTRREFCERYADGKTLVIGTHFATPSAGKIMKKDDSFRYVAA